MTTASLPCSGKYAVVTGASRGIGLAMARSLHAAGATVALLGRDRATLQRAATDIDQDAARLLPIVCDVADTDSIKAAFTELSAHTGRLDILVNNAGIEQLCPSLEVTADLWDRIVDTNLKGAFFCAQAAARSMSDGGSIINLCSLTSEVGVPGAAAYGASKSGLAGLTRALATEWAPLGIRVNGIGPGYFRTALTEVFYADPAWQQRMRSQIPMGRFGELNDLAGTTVFLASDASRYLTGQILYVDGGYLASL